MLDNKEIDDSSYTSIGGDFANVFDNSDYIALINSTDTAGIILRTHLILEDFINSDEFSKLSDAEKRYVKMMYKNYLKSVKV